jgi:hypothetical protein
MGGIQTFDRYGVRICKCGFTNTITIVLPMMSAICYAMLQCKGLPWFVGLSDYSATVLQSTSTSPDSRALLYNRSRGYMVTSSVIIFMSYLRCSTRT